MKLRAAKADSGQNVYHTIDDEPLKRKPTKVHLMSLITTAKPRHHCTGYTVRWTASVKVESQLH